MNLLKFEFRAFLLLIALFVQTSCSSIKPLATKYEPGPTPDQVDLGLPDSIDQGPEVTPNVSPGEETVRLGDRGGDTYTQSEDESETTHANVRKLRIGLSLGPALYRAINFVSVLKYLERQNLSPQIVTGTGFGAIVAAMYANGMTPEIIEWNFYRYFKEKGNHRLYSERWLEDIDQFLLEKLKNKNIQDSPKKFYMTLFDSQTKKTYYFDKGNIRDLLLQNLHLVSQEISKKSTRYTAAFENEVFNAKLMKRLGVDFTIAVDALGAKFDFKNSNEFLIGIYGKAAGRIAKEQKSFDCVFSFPLAKMSLDSTENGAFFLMETQKYVELQGSNLKKKIQLKASSLSDL